MKSIKRVIALALVFAMMLGCVSVFAYSDVPTGLSTPISVLTTLGIVSGYPDGTFKPEGDITRAEVASATARAIGGANVAAMRVETAYPDIPAEHWASGAVKLATDVGIVDGFPDGNYYGDDNVTYEQVTKMIVCALGYRSEAVANGGYPTGYLYVAQKIGLLDGVEGTVGANASRGTVAKMLYNALDIPLMLRQAFGDEEKHVVHDGINTPYRVTLLSRYFDVVKLGGLVVSNEVTGIKEGTVQFMITDIFTGEYAEFAGILPGFDRTTNTATFNVGDTNAAALLGKNTVAFVKISKDTMYNSTIIYIEERPLASTLTLDMSEVLSGAIKGDIAEVVYSLNGGVTEKTVKLDVSGKVYRNGVPMNISVVDEWFDDNFVTGSERYATITFYLVNTNSKAAYDFAFITEYQTLIVEKDVAANDTGITGIGAADDQYQFTYIPDAGEVYTNPITGTTLPAKVSIVDADGKAVAKTDLKANDVLTVVYAEGEDYVYFNAILSRETVTGKVEDVEGTGARMEVVIDGETYKVAMPGLVIDVDDEGTYSLDANGRLVMYDRTKSTNAYALVIGTPTRTAGGVAYSAADAGKTIEVYNINGKKETYTVSSSYKVDGKSSGTVSPTDLVRFSATDGVITDFYTLDSARTHHEFDDEVDGLATSVEKKTGYVEVAVDGGYEKLDTTAKLFVFDTPRSAIFPKAAALTTPAAIVDGSWIHAVKVVAASELEAGDLNGPMTIYNKVSGYHTMGVYEGELPETEATFELMMVESVKNAKNAAGEDASIITYSNGAGSGQKVTTLERLSAGALAKGDLIMVYRSGLTGEAVEIQVVDGLFADDFNDEGFKTQLVVDGIASRSGDVITVNTGSTQYSLGGKKVTNAVTETGGSLNITVAGSVAQIPASASASIVIKCYNSGSGSTATPSEAFAFIVK